MARYLVIHSPIEEEETTVRPVSDVTTLARKHGRDGDEPRWLRTWSPDLTDDRIFTLWDAEDAEAIDEVLQRYEFLNNMTSLPLRVQEWGPEDVLRAADADVNDD